MKQKIYLLMALSVGFVVFVSFSNLYTKDAQAGIFVKTVTDFMADGTWIAPGGVTTISIEGWGGGGAGAGNTASSVDGEGGGGGGAYAKVNSFTVTPGAGYATDVGAGGVGTSGDNVNGADSTFNGTTMVADGGLGGENEAGGNTGGAGGTVANSTGDVEYAGGTGGAGGVAGASNIGGGGGGGSAGAGGAGGNGGNGSAGVGGLAGTPGAGLNSILNFLWNDGAPGGAGSGGGASGATGYYPGAGGSGANVSTTLDRLGGSGVTGKIAITYVEPSSSGYPQFVSKGSFASSTATSGTVPLPPGYIKNDLIFLLISGRAAGNAGSSDTITVPTGWTQRGSRQREEAGLNDLVVELWYKFATSTSDSNLVSVGAAFSSSLNHWAMQTFAYRGVNQGTPFSATNVGGTSAASATFTPTGPTPTPLNSSNRSRVISFVVTSDSNCLGFDTSRQFLTRTGSNESCSFFDMRTTLGVSHGVADQATTTTSAAIMPIWEQVILSTDVWAYFSEALEPAPPSKSVVTFGAGILKIIGGVLKINSR